MKKAYCWRCKCFVVLIEPEHYKEFEDLYSEGIGNTKRYRETHGTTLDNTPRRETFAGVYAFYESLGGDASIDNEEIYKHRENRFGPKCPGCSKNFRTAEASFCAECGYKPGPGAESV